MAPLLHPNYQQQLDAILQAGTAKSTRRAYARDVIYFWAWAQLALQQGEHYPVSEEVVTQFILDHLGHMPTHVEQPLLQKGLRRKAGPLKVSTLRRMLSSLSVAHSQHGASTPTTSSPLKLLLRRGQQLQASQRKRQMRAITKDILEALLDSCDDTLHGARDKAILLVGFSTGGRRRSELANIQINDLHKIPEGYLLTLRKTKTDQKGKGLTVPIVMRAATALTQWLMQSGVRDGCLFRGTRGRASLTQCICGDSINSMIKRRIEQIGLDSTDFGAHSLRAGFMTQAANAGAVLGDAMALSGHRCAEVANGYYREASLLKNPAGKLLIE